MIRNVALGTISLNNVAGGLERNIIFLANRLSELGFKVYLYSFDFEVESSFYPISPEVNWVRLGVSRPHQKASIWEKLETVAKIRAAIIKHDIDCVICFSHGLFPRFILGSLFLGIQKYCSERNALSHYRFIKQRKWNLSLLALAFAKRITVQFHSYIKDYPFWLQHKIFVVNNPVEKAHHTSTLQENTIITVGRLVVQKQYSLLIDAFAICLKTHPNWRLKIIGEGPLKKDLDNHLRDLKITKYVEIHAPKEDISDFFDMASIYVNSSQWEGFPNALAEAMSHGLICVGFENTCGVPDLISNGKNGFLASGGMNEKNLSSAINKAIELRKEWLRISKEAQKVSFNYSPDNSMSQWMKVLS